MSNSKATSKMAASTIVASTLAFTGGTYVNSDKQKLEALNKDVKAYEMRISEKDSSISALEEQISNLELEIKQSPKEVVKIVTHQELTDRADSSLRDRLKLATDATNLDVAEGWEKKEFVIAKQAEEISHLKLLNAKAAAELKNTAANSLRAARAERLKNAQ